MGSTTETEYSQLVVEYCPLIKKMYIPFATDVNKIGLLGVVPNQILFTFYFILMYFTTLNFPKDKTVRFRI